MSAVTPAVRRLMARAWEEGYSARRDEDPHSISPEPNPYEKAEADDIEASSEDGCHPRCSLGPNADHPGYLAYRCITEAVEALPWPGEDGYDQSLTPDFRHVESLRPERGAE